MGIWYSSSNLPVPDYGRGEAMGMRTPKNADKTMSVVRLRHVDAPNVLIVPMAWLAAVVVESSYRQTSILHKRRHIILINCQISQYLWLCSIRSPGKNTR
jgi:hypothetical protein